MAKFKCAGSRRKALDGAPYCTYESDTRWIGPCPVQLGGCGRFYDIVKERPYEDASKLTLATLADVKPPDRLLTGCKELDYVLGGGIVVGSTYVLTGPPGLGKCLGRGTPVLMFDGTIKAVEDIVVGDRLMGPDSIPRTVRSTTKGVGPLFNIVPIKGDPWVCNDVHVLTLVESGTDRIFDIPLDQYLRYPGWCKSRWKLFQPDEVRFEHTPANQSQLLSPYFVGLRTGFKVKPIGEGDYFGFTLDGDGRFLLGDFTVTHNTTVLLQTAYAVAEVSKKSVLITSGEQNQDDIVSFASRLDISSNLLHVRGSEGDVYKITSEAERLKPALIVVDSVQTAFISDAGGDVGSAEQIKAVTNWLTSFGKVEKISVIIVSHVTKSGEMAGPRVMEHLIDCCCYLDRYTDNEDENIHEDQDLEFLDSLREFSIGKNRWGRPGLRAVVQMTEKGLQTPDRLVGDRIILPR